jgi:methyl-accepting chemotaxis protein
MSFRQRLLLSLAVGVVGVCLLLGLFLRANLDASARLQRVNDVALPTFEAARGVRAELREQQRALQDATAADDADGIAAAEAELGRLESTIAGLGRRGLVEDVVATRLAAELKGFSTSAVKVARATARGDRSADVVAAMEQMVAAARAVDEGLAAVQEQASTQVRRDLEASRAEQARLLRVIGVGGLLGLGYLVVVVLVIVRPVSRLAASFARLAEGRRGERLPVDSDDEFGRIARDANTVLDRLDELAEVASAIAEGRQGRRVTVRGDDDALASAFNRLADWIDEMAVMASRIAAGEVVRVQPRSADDLLGRSFQEMTASLDDSVRVAEAIAGGDLEVEVRRRGAQDRLGAALADMVVALRTASSASSAAAHRLKESGQRLSSTARGVEGQARLQADGALALQEKVDATGRQAERIAEKVSVLVAQAGHMRRHLDTVRREVDDGAGRIGDVSRGMGQLSASASGVADAVTAVRDNARAFARVQETVAQSARSMREAATAMVGRIDERGTELTSLVDEVARRASEIARIVDVVNAIVEQTSLVALNASIVAAQADARGAAFAVVADEVKRLAQTSRASMSEIGQSVEQIAGDAGRMGHTVRVLLDEIRSRGDEVAGGSADVVAAMGDQQARVQRLEQVAEGLASQSRTVAEVSVVQRASLTDLEARLHSLRTLAGALGDAVAAVDRAVPLVRDAVVEQRGELGRAVGLVRGVAEGAARAGEAVATLASEAVGLESQARSLTDAVDALGRRSG